MRLAAAHVEGVAVLADAFARRAHLGPVLQPLPSTSTRWLKLLPPWPEHGRLSLPLKLLYLDSTMLSLPQGCCLLIELESSSCLPSARMRVPPKKQRALIKNSVQLCCMTFNMTTADSASGSRGNGLLKLLNERASYARCSPGSTGDGSASTASTSSTRASWAHNAAAAAAVRHAQQHRQCRCR